MEEVVISSVLIALAFFGAVAAALGFAGALHFASRKKSVGYLHYVFYAILATTSILIFFSKRDLSLSALNLPGVSDVARNPIASLTQRISTVLLIFVALERILNYLSGRKKEMQAPPFLLSSFVLFWFGTVAITALFASHPQLSHEYGYTLILGVAAALSSTYESHKILRAARNGILIFVVIGLVLIPVTPRLVIDMSYTQGYIAGLPRFAGLSPHALTLGMLAQVSILILWVHPFKNSKINFLSYVVLIFVMILAQSKTALVSFFICSLCMVWVRHGNSLKKRFADANNPSFGILVVIVGMFTLLGLGVAILFGDMGQKINRFIASDEGTQLVSLTGRDQIWRIALEEWHRNPIFGYGPRLFDEAYRASVSMGNATHAHNQFVDTLARSGLIGEISLVIYFIVLMVLSIRYAKTSGGLTLALFITLAIRSISEIPLTLFAYGPEFLLHMLLLIALAGEARKRRRSTYGVSMASFKYGRNSSLNGSQRS